uniref:Uncharacterized protein n=1 Tax=Anguilla anguilla TaxID=7936 RepID=A0A0E9PPJ9_ANGAN
MELRVGNRYRLDYEKKQ